MGTARLNYRAGLDQSAMHLTPRSAELRRQVLDPVRRARVSKIWMPGVTKSLRCRRLRGEERTTLREYLEGLARLMDAGLGRIAREAVQPIADLVSPRHELRSPAEEAADVHRVGGPLHGRFVAAAADGLTPTKAAEMLPDAETYLQEVSEWVEALRRRAQGGDTDGR